jgi:hypothetical protein
VSGLLTAGVSTALVVGGVGSPHASAAVLPAGRDRIRVWAGSIAATARAAILIGRPTFRAGCIISGNSKRPLFLAWTTVKPSGRIVEAVRAAFLCRAACVADRAVVFLASRFSE